MLKLRNYIDGALVEPKDRRYLESIDPSMGAPWAMVPDSDEADLATAVDAAARAFSGWKAMPAADRAAILLRIADLIETRADMLAEAESADSGKPVALARSLDIPRSAQNFRFFATAAQHFASEAHRTDDVALNYTLRSPRGVAGLISPWNLPLYLLTWKIAPALSVGNTAVAKPSELTSITAFHLAEICIEAGLPAGVLNIVFGYGHSVGAALVAHPNVPVISFTGGTATGATLARTAGPMFKKLALELGGKNPTIVFGDVKLDDVVLQARRAAFSNQGQICLCGSRILVERTIYDAFVEKFVAATKSLVVGDPKDAKTDVGALISRAHWEKVDSYVQLGRQEGGQILCGGTKPERLPTRCAAGFFYMPTVIAGLDAHCRVNQEEIFGPVVSIMPFDTDADAIRIANATPYGLAASVWTENLSRAHRVAESLESGTVWVNCWMQRDLRVPFGGTKASGVGREGGLEALRFFTEPKNICIKY